MTMQKTDGLGRSPDGRLFLILAIAVLAVATVIRIYGAFNDLWLDEIWSIKIAGQVVSPSDIFTKLHHEINHHLNTLWLWFIGNRGNWPGYRIPSLLAGSGTVIFAGLIGRRRNRTTAFMAMLVLGFSYVLILYSSEARGYAMAIFFAFLSYYALDHYLEKSRWPWAVIFSISGVLGMASQPIFAAFLLAALLWTIVRLAKPFRGRKSLIAGLLSCHLVPWIFLAFLYWVDLRKVVPGGGTPSASLIDAYGTALAWGIGTPLSDTGKFLTCAGAIAILCAGVCLLWNEQSDSWIFFLSVIVVFPILLIVIRGSNIIYTRHFIIGLAFLLLLFSYVLASLCERGRRGQFACAALFAGYFFINGQLLITFFKYGRGHYSEAIQFMANQTRLPLVTIGSDHDFQTSTILNFYGPKPLGGKEEKYFERDSWPLNGPEWFVCHKESFEPPTPPAMQLTDNEGHRYELVKIFPTAPLSGLHWFIYHNQVYSPVASTQPLNP